MIENDTIFFIAVLIGIGIMAYFWLLSEYLKKISERRKKLLNDKYPGSGDYYDEIRRL